MKKLAVTLFIVFSLVSLVYAQDNPVCPPDMLLAFARSGSACFSLERNEGCIGNGTVESQLYPSDTQATPFVKPGDIVDAGILHDVHTEVIDKGISTVMLYTQANLTDAEQHNVALFLFGDATVENEVAPLPEMTAYATGALNIRATPDDNGTILASLAVNKAVIANGRTQAGDWLRVHVPNSNDLGWVAANVVKSDGNLLNLTVVDVTTPVFRPFQIFKLTTGNATSCGGALPSGLLLQSPSSVNAKLAINGADVQLSGAAFLQTNGALTLDVLNGEATISFNGTDVYVPAGARTQIPLGGDGAANSAAAQAEPYDLPGLQALPINNLPFRMQLAAALTTDEITQKMAEHEAALLMAEATAEPPVADNTCKRIVRRDTTLWGGPGSFYEAVENIKVGTVVSPVLETTDPDGKVWWQLDNTNWIEGDLVIQSGICEDIPVVANAPAPEYNELSLETCETTNGPLRAGQEVEIHFLPPAFDSLEDAQNAPNIDPGSITIGTQFFYPYASEPIYIGKVGDTKRYVVQFETYWTATPGTFRIVGDRLHYTPICTVTVPVG